MAARTGDQLLRGLAGGPREIWVGSDKVSAPADHPALRGAGQALADAKLRPLIDQYLAGVGVDTEQRSRLFRLARDFAGTALASRKEQCERFYLGSVGRNLTSLQTFGDRTRALRRPLLERRA